MLIMLLLPKYPVVVKLCHLAHRFHKCAYPRTAVCVVQLGVKFGSSSSSGVDALISLMVIMRSNQAVGHKT